MALINKEDFLIKYNVQLEEFESSGLEWAQLEVIYSHYIEQITTLTTTASTISEILRSNPNAHSVRSRIKNPEHLIHKIIRKTIREKQKEGNEQYTITLENYLNEVTDLIGIRVLHLYKDQALSIDHMIRNKWNLIETATIYIRSGDIIDPVLKESTDYVFKEHPAAYRSWHYLIKTNVTKEDTIVEIQVRTIFEEGWSEVDHQLRYPLELENQLLNNQLLVLNRLAGNADEMVNAIRETKKSLNDLNKEKVEQENLIQELKKEIEELYKDKNIQEGQLISLQEKISKLESYQRRNQKDLSELVSSSTSIFDVKNLVFNNSVKSSDTMRATAVLDKPFNNSILDASKVIFETSPTLKSAFTIIDKRKDNKE
ncbi:hypothetical protein BABA_00740 [Neobacillus bataviensis LMG 21833]|uniref:RelA/SpoT domain-containing protein n=1 Tax=Neobacillus bataviensis LMG 21833 TaxID=1117379 RepID=K6DTM2_9BACI|nr:hypothetical protein [Neobacillus bataviensis]EKN71593.1 hypothetical protein BABA_00740 [Neobacillus bataviensis LMG 21833]